MTGPAQAITSYLRLRSGEHQVISSAELGVRNPRQGSGKEGGKILTEGNEGINLSCLLWFGAAAGNCGKIILRPVTPDCSRLVPVGPVFGKGDREQSGVIGSVAGANRE